MIQYFHGRGLDMAKDGISIPGLALKDLFNEQECFFSLVHRNDADMHKTIKDGIVGGVSLIFHRYHASGETRIREREFGEVAKLCGGIVGFDANA